MRSVIIILYFLICCGVSYDDSLPIESSKLSYKAKMVRLSKEGSSPMDMTAYSMVSSQELLIPIQDFLIELGYTLTTDQEGQSLLFLHPKNQHSLKLELGEKRYVLNGQEKVASEPVVTIDGQCYAPLSLLSDFLDFQIRWDSKKSIIHLMPNTFFKNRYYNAQVDSIGNLKILDSRQRDILTSVSYESEYGSIYDATEGTLRKGSKQITLEQTAGLVAGDTIEIRAESYMGRMNRPLVHRAKVSEIKDHTVSFAPSVPVKMDYGIFIKKVTALEKGLQEVTVHSWYDSEQNRVLSIIGSTDNTWVKIKYTFHPDSPAVDVNVTTQYKRTVDVFYERMIFNFAPPVSEVYRKNRKVDTTSFQREYWLDKQGVKFGEGMTSAFVYHTPKVSSLQLFTAENQLRVNLDDMHDHRFFEHEETRLTGHIQNTSVYGIGDERENDFRIVFGYSPDIMPRLMAQPDGFLATHIWTEHADQTTLASNRAVYFGNSFIESADEAVGGFVKYGIPVTKSVFYSNPHYKAGGSDVAIKEEPRFVDFLDELYERGYEMALHTVHPAKSPDPDTLDEALLYMKNRYNTVTWIDHGNLDVNLAFDGLSPDSQHFAGRLWEKHGTQYFWHYSSEDITSANDELNLLQTKRGDRLRTPMYWRHPTRLNGFYSFAAGIITEDDFYHYNTKNLQELVQEWGVFINHAYPPRASGSTTKYFAQDSNGILYAASQFNNILKTMAHLREERKLYTTTIQKIMDYWIALENIELEYLENGSVRVFNHNDKPIHGLAFAARAPLVYVDGRLPNQKKVGSDIIFWFDISGKGSVTITSTKENKT